MPFFDGMLLDFYLWRWIHKVKLQEILNTQGFEKEDDIGQICTLDFWQCCDEHFIFVLPFRVETETLARTGTAGSTCPLVGVGLTDGVDLKGVHTNARIVHFEFTKARVNYEHDAVDCQRRLGDVGGHDALAYPVGGLLENFGL